MAGVLLEARNLVKHFPVTGGGFLGRRGAVRAVDGISFEIMQGETLGLVGESGCGKSTTGRLILRLIEATSGEVRYAGRNIMNLKKLEMRALRREMQIIFQDPYASLNPKMTVAEIIGEPIRAHGIAKGGAARDLVGKALEMVGLTPEYSARYPHEFSGGQRQRIGIARALVMNPRLIVCDEPLSALDVSIQAQVVNLLQDLQEEHGFSYLFISHDLSVVKRISNRIAVMYLGKIVEMADRDELYGNPCHPYTEALLMAVPVPDPLNRRKRLILEGDAPSPLNPPSGCGFRTRCRYAREICAREVPELRDRGGSHLIACHLRSTGSNQ